MHKSHLLKASTTEAFQFLHGYSIYFLLKNLSEQNNCMDLFLLGANIVLLHTAKQHLLAVGDAMGTLHILSIPWSLRQPTPNEVGNWFSCRYDEQ